MTATLPARSPSTPRRGELIEFAEDCSALTADEEKALAAAMRSGSVPARKRLVASQVGWIRTLARRHSAGRPGDFDELVSLGGLALAQRIDRFDPSKGRLTTFATYTIVSAFRDDADARRRQAKREPLSLDAPTADGATLAAAVADRDPFADVADRVVHREDVVRVRRCLERLDERDRRILVEAANGRPLAAAGPMMGVGRARVGQIHRRAVRRLRDEYERGRRTPAADHRSRPNAR